MLKAEKKLYFFIVCSVIGTLLSLIYSFTIIADNTEHLRMSWLVSQGEVPYRDFFEHHHPLLWYAFAPIISILPHNIILIFYTAKGLSLFCSALTYYIVYLIIKRFLGGKKNTLYFFVILFTFYPIWYGSSLFKPDVFAHLFYFIGLYLFFAYLENQKLKNLVFAAINFTIAFLFLQTIVFSILPLVIPIGIDLYKKPKTIFNYVKASLIPLTILGGCVALLIYANAWQEYYQLNWVFNSHLFKFLHSEKSSKLWQWSLLFVFVMATFITEIKYRKTSYFYNIIGLLFITEMIQHIYFSAVYPHYLILLFYWTALILTPIVKEIFENEKYKDYRKLIYIFIYAMLILNYTTLYLINNQNFIFYFKKINQLPHNEYISIDAEYISVYKPKNNYYVMSGNLHEIDNHIFHRFPEYDINALIKKEKPKYINYNRKIKNIFKEKRFRPDSKILEDYQEIAPNIWQRKETIE